MKLGDNVCVINYGNEYYKAVGRIVRLFDAVINTYPEKMATLRFEPSELLKLGIALTCKDADFKREHIGSVDFLSKHGRSYSAGERVVVINPDRARTVGQTGSVVGSYDDMMSVRLDSGTEHWYMAAELEYQHMQDKDWSV